MGVLSKKKISKNLWHHGYRIEIYPTPEQKEFLDKCIDISRFIYNWTIEQEELQFQLFLEGETKVQYITYFNMVPKFTELRSKHEFLNSVPYHTAANTIKRACEAYLFYFNKSSGKPKFKSKKKCKTNSFETRNESMYFEDNMFHIEGLPGLIYTKYHSGLDKKFRQFRQTVISRDNMNRYFVSFAILEPKPLTYFEDNNIKPLNKAIGIDLNVKKRFVLSTGKVYYGPDLSRELVNLNNKQSRVGKDINRRKKMERANPLKNCQSKRADKRLRALQKLYKRITNITENFIQQTTKEIISMRPKAIVMEDLVVTDMTQNHHIAKNIHHASFKRCIVVMKYKADKYGIPFIQAPKDYPSTQICSSCGNIQEMNLNQKTYKCEKCGLVIDRDINAALNLEHLAYAIA